MSEELDKRLNKDIKLIQKQLRKKIHLSAIARRYRLTAPYLRQWLVEHGVEVPKKNKNQVLLDHIEAGDIELMQELRNAFIPMKEIAEKFDVSHYFVDAHTVKPKDSITVFTLKEYDTSHLNSPMNVVKNKQIIGKFIPIGSPEYEDYK